MQASGCTNGYCSSPGECICYSGWSGSTCTTAIVSCLGHHAVTELSTAVVGPGRSHARSHSLTLPAPTCERRHRTYMSVPAPHPALSPPSLYLSAFLLCLPPSPSACPFSTRPSPASSPHQASRGRAWSSVARTSGPALRRRRSPVRHTKLSIVHIIYTPAGAYACLISSSHAMMPVANVSCPITSRTSTLITCTAPAGSGRWDQLPASR